MSICVFINMYFRKNLKKLIFGLIGVFMIAQFVFFGLGVKQAQAVIPPLVTVLSPNGGEQWEVGKTYNITWQTLVTGNNYQYVFIKLQYLNGYEQSIVEYYPANTGSYSWTIGDLGVDQYKVKVYLGASAGSLPSMPNDLSNNYFNIVPYSTSSSDFVITNIRFDPLSPSAGQTFTSYVTFKNIGGTKTGDYWGFNILGQFPGSNQNDFGGGWFTSGPFVNNQTYETSLGNSKINQAGSYTINFKIDSLNQITESNENNNNYTASIVVRPKLSDPQNIIVESETGAMMNTYKWDNISIHWTNPSDIDASKTKISIYRSNKSGELGSLLSGFPYYVNSIQGYYDKNVEPYVPYYYTLIYTADDGRISTGNKEYTGVLKKPDVKISNINFPSQVVLGNPKNLNITLVNDGDGKMLLDWLELKIDITGPKNTTVTSTISTGLRLIPANYSETSAIPVVSLVKEYTHSVPLNFTELGNYTINVTVDPNNKLVELYKNNNSKQTTTQAVISSTLSKDIKVISPNGYEQWEKGKTYNIQWEGVTDIGWSGAGVAIDLYRYVNDNLTFVKQIATGLSLQSKGSYIWTVPLDLASGSGYKIRMDDYASYDFSDNSFIIKDSDAGQSIQVISPNGGEKWAVGKTYNITWTSTGNLSKVSIILWRSDNHGQFIVENIPNTGSYSWTIGDLGVGQYEIRVSGIDYSNATDISDNYFSIVPASSCIQVITPAQNTTTGECKSFPTPCDVPSGWTKVNSCPVLTSSITVLSPNGGEQWAVGKTYNITWQTTTPTSSYTLYTFVFARLVRSSDGYEQFIADYLPNTGSYSWTIGDLGVGQYKIKAYLGASAGSLSSAPNDLSNNYFSIVSTSTGNLPPVIDSLTGPTQLNINEKGAWKIQAHDPENGTLTYNIDWGDSKGYLIDINAAQLTTINQTATFSHVYSTSGNYTIKVKVFDNKELSAEASLTVSVVGETGWKTYTNHDYHYQLQYPENWSYTIGSAGNVISFYEGNWKGEGEAVLTVEGNTTLAEEYDKVKKIFEAKYKVTESAMQVAGKNAKLLTIINSSGFSKSIFFENDNRIFNFSILATKESWFDQILSTFKFIGDTTPPSDCLPDGTLIKMPNDFKVYVIQDCKKKWIQSIDEFKQSGYKWNNVTETSADTVNAYNDYIQAVAKLLKIANQEKVYRIVGNRKLWVPSPQAFNKQGLKWQDVQTTDTSSVNQYLDAKLLKSANSATIYYITNTGMKRAIPNTEVFNSYGNKMADVIEVDQSVIDSYPDNNLIRLENGIMVYKLENGTKRWIATDKAFKRLGLDWSKIAPVNQTELNAYPSGATIE